MNYFSKKEVQTIDELKRQVSDDYGICRGKNELSTLTEDTEIVVVGTFIPPFLVYFYNENTYLYKAIDIARGTQLEKYKRKYPAHLSEQEKNKIIDRIKDILLKEKIAFIDLFDTVLIKHGSTKDKDIKGYVLDKDVILKLKQFSKIKKVISITENVESLLLANGVVNDYVKLFPGKSKRYPKGTDYLALWTNIFRIN